MENYLKVFLSPDVKPAAVRGRPWIFANQLKFTAEMRALTPGSVVRVSEADGRLLGLYHFNPHSLIAARLLSRNPARQIDAAFFRDRIDKALRLRQRLFAEPYYRLIHGEGDNLPGLVIDRLGDTLVVQPNTAGMDSALPLILSALQSLLQPTSILIASDSPARGIEGLEPVNRIAAGTLEGPVTVLENGVKFLADPVGGQKTGWFFDHRLNRQFAGQLAKGTTLLDLYTYAGGFALTGAAAGATQVTAVDRSAPALALAQKSAEVNGFQDCVTFETAEVFAWLGANERKFGVVVADPPAFAKVKKDVPSALKGYEKLARMAAGAVEADGFLCIASCSHHVTAEAFRDATADGLRAAGRAARLIHQAAAGPDHPVHPLLPQTAYLKFLVYALE